MEEFTLMDMFITTISVLLSMAVVCCLFCLCMKISDLRLKCYIIETAEKKGISVDVDKLESNAAFERKDENCIIMVPDVCIAA